MKILITGATGFIGSHVAKLAHAEGHAVSVLVRRADHPNLADLTTGAVHVGDLEQPDSLAPAVEGIDAVIHCAAATSGLAHSLESARRINVEGTAALVSAAVAKGKPRWIQISTMSAHPESTSVYGRTKFEADEEVRKSELPWTILRLSLVFGDSNRGLVSKTIEMMKKLPVLPVIGTGRELIRPIHADDVAKGVLQAIECEKAAGKTYMIGSADEVTLDRFFDSVAEGAGLRKLKIHIPVPIGLLIAGVLGTMNRNPPITRDNVLGIRELKPVEIQAACDDFGFSPSSFEEGLARTFAGDSS